MTAGPGKYDDICTTAREQAGGSVLLIVIDGNMGSGFSCQTSIAVASALPDMLESIARQLRGDVGELTKGEPPCS